MSDTTHITVTPEVLYQLQAATPQSARKSRQGPKKHDGDCQKQYGVCQLPHKDLTYVDARYVMGVLDSEVGPGNWQDEYIVGAGGKVACRIGIYIEGRGWVWKGDGAGETDIEGEKGSFSDAFKRAAVKWGVARDLYGETPTTQGQNGIGVTDAAQSPLGEGAYQPAPTAPVVSPAQPVAVSPESDPLYDPSKCPAHGWDWRVQPGGTSKAGKAYKAFYKCGGKTSTGAFCPEKPTDEWVAAHPIAA